MGKYAERLTEWPHTASNMGGWQERHMAAVLRPVNHGEGTVGGLIRAWLDYADEHARHFESGIGEDGFLGKEWAAIGAAIRGLLNGDCGRLDCGTLDGILYNTLKDEGFNPDDL